MFAVASATRNSGDAEYRSPYLSHAKRALYHLSYILVVILSCSKGSFSCVKVSKFDLYIRNPNRRDRCSRFAQKGIEPPLSLSSRSPKETRRWPPCLWPPRPSRTTLGSPTTCCPSTTSWSTSRARRSTSRRSAWRGVRYSGGAGAPPLRGAEAEDGSQDGEDGLPGGVLRAGPDCVPGGALGDVLGARAERLLCNLRDAFGACRELYEPSEVERSSSPASARVPPAPEKAEHQRATDRLLANFFNNR